MPSEAENTSLEPLISGNCSTEEALKAERVHVHSVQFILPISVLIVFNVVVIVGNSLVILAVFTHTKLRTATNMFIVSLAVADLMLGIMVLPFSSANEVIKGYWPFGYIWCRIWLAVDVLLCTASILNLCAISLDRYLAISRPFKYPRLMSPLRAKILVGVVWIVSFIVCFPPLVGWNERGKGLHIGDNEDAFLNENTEEGAIPEMSTLIRTLYITNDSFLSGANALKEYSIADNKLLTSQAPLQKCPEEKVCNLEADYGYRIYSAFGSFWVPVWIMVFFYWRIYLTAARTTKSLRRGVITKKASNINNSPSEVAVTLRVHRGGGSNSFKASRRYTKEDSISSGLNKSEETRCRKVSDSLLIQPKHDVAMRCVSEPADTCSLSKENKSKCKPPRIKITFSKANRNRYGYGSSLDYNASSPSPSIDSGNRSPDLLNGVRKATNNSGLAPASCPEEAGESSRFNILNKGRTHVKAHLKRLNKETKAAKTVGVIVGCFIICWAPFFTVYLVDAFCGSCTPSLLFTIFFWLGYCNSAINPCLYALCSKDFRYAFKKLIRCRCEAGSTSTTSGTRLASLLNSVRIQISSRGSDSNSD